VLQCIARDPGVRPRDRAPIASSPTWPPPGTSSSRRTAAATATRSRRTAHYQNPPAPSPPSARSWLSLRPRQLRGSPSHIRPFRHGRRSADFGALPFGSSGADREVAASAGHDFVSCRHLEW